MPQRSLYDFLSISPAAPDGGEAPSGTHRVAPPLDFAPRDAAPDGDPTLDAGTASFLDPGQFFFNIQQLARQNPLEFRGVAAQVASKLKGAAVGAGHASGAHSRFLTNLANIFNQASKTGVLRLPHGPFSRQFNGWWREAMEHETFETVWGGADRVSA
jgi:hypothetical protein